MNLVIDIGNTLLKSALFNENELLENHSFSFDMKVLNEKINSHKGPVLISSVRKEVSAEILQKKSNLFFLGPDTKIPIVNCYETPRTLGNDRLANAVAIHALSKGKNALAIDCGTCLKFDLVVKNQYLGGSISPGLKMRFQSLHTLTSNLPLVEAEKFDQLNGLSTKNSILSGCYRGMLAEIKQTISDYKQQYDELEVYLTGGDHGFFADPIKNRIFADPFLTLKGLNEILNYQK